MGNKAFIRATKFTGLASRFLKHGQPGIFFRALILDDLINTDAIERR